MNIVILCYTFQCLTDDIHETISFLIFDLLIVGQATTTRNGINQLRVPHSMPSSPQQGAARPVSFEVVGSAENLVGRVLAQQGLGKYCDPDFVAKEMQEALDMTSEEMDMAAHILLQSEKEQPNQKNQPKAPPRQSRNARDKL